MLSCGDVAMGYMYLCMSQQVITMMAFSPHSMLKYITRVIFYRIGLDNGAKVRFCDLLELCHRSFQRKTINTHRTHAPSLSSDMSLRSALQNNSDPATNGTAWNCRTENAQANTLMTKDAHGELIGLSPQPSDDANDPLNWTKRKKMSMLLVISAVAFLADYGSSTGAVTSVAQSNLLWVPTTKRQISLN